MDQGLSPAWTILQQVYNYVSLLDRAVKQLCNVSIVHVSDTVYFRSFCSTTILTSNQRDVILEPTRNTFAMKQEKSLRFIVVSIDKHGWARGAAYMENLSLLHKRLGDEVMTFLLTKCSLFVKVGTNHVQIAGLPIYNVLALNYTPLLIKRVPVKRKRNSKQMEQKDSINASNEVLAISASVNRVAEQNKVCEPPTKKLKTDDLQQELQGHPMSSNARPAIRDVGLQLTAPLVHTSTDSLCTARSLCGMTKQRNRRKLRRKAGLLLTIHTRRKLQFARERKRLASRVKKQANGVNNTSSPERCLLKSVRNISHTSFRKADSMYSSAPNEALKKSHLLNVYNATRRGAVKLVKGIFIDKPQAQAKNKNRGNKVNRLPKRLQPVVPLFQALLSNYKKMSGKIVHILNTVCSTQQCELKEGKDKLLLKLQCNQEQVMRFIVCVLNSVIPPDLWGCPENQKMFFTHLRRYIVCLRRWERMSVCQLMKGIRTTHCAWLRLWSGCKSSRSDTQKQTELIGRFFSWLMGLVVDLIKGYFYATEHCDHHNRVLYYRKTVWNRLCKAALDERRGMLVQLSQEEVYFMLSQGKSLGVSNLRFMPKTSSLRPITNLGAVAKLNPAQFQLSGQREGKSVNAQLVDLFNILKFEKSRRVGSSSCLGYRDIHSRLTSFSERLCKAESLPGRQPLYIVHMDVTNCYDSVEPRLMYSIIQKRVLTEKLYLLRRHTTVMISNKSIRRAFIKTGTTRELCEPFVQYVEKSSLRNAIFTDMVAYPLIDRLQLLSQLKSHLFNNIVKFRGQCFRQIKGIPQGSCISSLLCSFYYDEMEKDHLPRVNPETGLLMHYVDDFLLVTPDPLTAKSFLQTMTKGIPEYNCFVNPNKTSTNFTIGEDGSVRLDEEKQWIPWCGLLINTRTLEVRSDYSRYTKKKIRDHLTVITHSRPFHNLHRLVKRAVRLKCQPIFLDCELLSEKTVLSNIYQLFLLVAVKTHAAVRALQLRGRGVRRYTKFLFSVIQQSTKSFYNMARITCRKKEGGITTFTLPLELCTWLGCHAYQRVLKMKDSCGYGLLVKILSSQISTVADTMGLNQVKRCLRATSLVDCQPIIRLKC